MATQHVYQIWCLGLSQEDLHNIRTCAHENHEIVDVGLNILEDLATTRHQEPVLLWLGLEAWQKLGSGIKSSILGEVPQILVLPETSMQAELSLVVNAGFQEIVVENMSIPKICEILRNSLELCNVYRDMERMSREIVLGRELFEKKSVVFDFLLSFMREVIPGSIASILSESKNSLSEMLPVEAVHAVFWQKDLNSVQNIFLHLDLAQKDAELKSAWSKILLSASQTLAPTPRAMRQTKTLLTDLGSYAKAPHSDRILLLPIVHREVPLGALAIALEHEYHLGRDQVLALDAACNHLALIVNDLELLESQGGNYYTDKNFSSVAARQ